MGFILLNMQQQMLLNNVNELQYSLTTLTREKLKISKEITDLTSGANEIGNHESPSMKKLEAKMHELKHLEAKMDSEIQQRQTQLQAAQTQLDSVKQSMGNAIKSSFGINYGGG